MSTTRRIFIIRGWQVTERPDAEHEQLATAPHRTTEDLRSAIASLDFDISWLVSTGQMHDGALDYCQRVRNIYAHALGDKS